jgi:hypothetical protein
MYDRHRTATVRERTAPVCEEKIVASLSRPYDCFLTSSSFPMSHMASSERWL